MPTTKILLTLPAALVQAATEAAKRESEASGYPVSRAAWIRKAIVEALKK